MNVITRRRLEMALGGLWLLDGALQLQPHMFTAAFFSDTLGMANMGLPAPLSRVYYDITTMIAGHPAAWNGLFAALQLALGFMFLRGGRALTVARPLSLAWALGVWAIGEGFGGMFMGGGSVLNGAPGSALGYAFITLALWPRRGTRGRVALAAWSAVWMAVALLETAGTNRMPFVPGAEIRDAAGGEPGLVAALDRSVGNLVGLHGAWFAGVTGVVAALIALVPWWSRLRRPALAAGMVVGALLGLIGGDLGGILTGRGTDPGLAPVFVLLGLVAWVTAVDVPELSGDRAPLPVALRPRVRAAAGDPVALPAG